LDHEITFNKLLLAESEDVNKGPIKEIENMMKIVIKRKENN